jgi:hypothetical protein
MEREADGRREQAATVVQRAFRRFINVRIYKYYRNLVNFRNRGDPGSVCPMPAPPPSVACTRLRAPRRTTARLRDT